MSWMTIKSSPGALFRFLVLVSCWTEINWFKWVNEKFNLPLCKWYCKGFCNSSTEQAPFLYNRLSPLEKKSVYLTYVAFPKSHPASPWFDLSHYPAAAVKSPGKLSTFLGLTLLLNSLMDLAGCSLLDPCGTMYHASCIINNDISKTIGMNESEI